ncbi:MAG: M6 family metalloprotease domain-containing protein [Candidatus Coatesbacteria bacterium]|nr:MAG: M6 family metalloprotease domain-containing protein [Candidatus Coatesbacteria bacterium]
MRILLITCLLAGFVVPGTGMPPNPGAYDENGLHVVTGAPLPEFPEWFGKPGSLHQRLSGTGSSVAVLVDFPDRPHDPSHPESAYDELLYSDNEYPTGSLRDFFQENSFYQYDVEGEAYGWYTTPDDYYDNYNDGNYGLSWGGRLVALRAAELSDPDVNYGLYDNDGPDGVPNSGDDDGYVDLFLVFHADPGGEDTGDPNDIWSHKWNLSPAYETDDPKAGGGYIKIYDYAIQPEEETDGAIIGISVVCHEMGHVIGLPDLYDYSRWTLGIGLWGLMGYGAWGGDGIDGRYPSHLCAWSKERLDWVTPTVVTEDMEDVTLRPVEQYQDVYKIWRDGSPGQEYFLIANRQNVGFDQTLVGTGILIWHIDHTLPQWHNVVDLEEADGLDDLEHGDGERPDPYEDNIGDDGDPYPGSSDATAFAPHTYPNSDDNDGVPTNITISGFETVGLSLICDIYLDSTDVKVTHFSARPDAKGIEVTWDVANDGTLAGFNLYRETAGNEGKHARLATVREKLNGSLITGSPPYVFDDLKVKDGTTYRYWLEVVDVGGGATEYGPAEATAGAGTPTSFALGNARPNPSSGKAIIPFALPEDACVELGVYDIAGRKVATLADGRLSSGEHTREVTGLPPGNYIYRLETPGYIAVRKLVVVGGR